MSTGSIVAEGRFLRLVSVDTWEYVQRTQASGVVCVAAVTDNNHVILVEQFRPPLSATVIELPAGLAGDEGNQHESFEMAARRELLEETGYEAADWTQLCDVASSAGLTDEMVTVFRARGLRKTGSGGGVAGESITVHEVPLDSLFDWLLSAAEDGKKVDSRVYGLPAFLKM